MSVDEPTYLISSYIPNAFVIENIQENDVFMSLKNNVNKLDIRLSNQDFIFQAQNENTKLTYNNIDFDVDEINLNKISTLDYSNLTLDGNVNIVNGYLTHYNNHVLVLNENNEIPYTYFSNLNKERINVYDSNVYIDNSLVMINTCNITKDAAVTIKNNATNTEEITVKLVDRFNNPTIKIYSQKPLISIGSNIQLSDTTIQLAVESNIKCNDIIVNTNSFNDFYNEYQSYKQSNNIMGLTKINDSNLEFNNIKLILEPDIEHLRTKDDFNFTSTNTTISIKNIYCLHLKTFILTLSDTLYELLPDNKYTYVDNNIETIKSENNALIYTKQNKLYFIYDDKSNVIDNTIIGGYYDNYRYFVKNNEIIKRHKDEIVNEISVTFIDNVTNIYVTNHDAFYFIKNKELYHFDQGDITQLEQNVSNFTLTYNSYMINNHTDRFTSSLTSNYYYIEDSNLYDQDDLFITSNVLTMDFSLRHIVLLKSDYKIYTKTFSTTDTYAGLGRSYLSILDNTLTNFVGLSIPTNDNVNFAPSVNIGGSLNTFNNQTPNSLCVENCLSIGCRPLNDFALRLKGDILIEDGNIYRNTNKSDLFDNVTTPLTLDDFVNKSDFDFEIDKLTNTVDNILTSNLLENKKNIIILSDLLTSNIDNLIDDVKNVTTIWDRDVDITTINNTRVLINPSGNDDYSVLGGGKTPSLFVGNYGTNIKGLICEDDIAAYSDEKLKTDIKPISNSLQKVLQLNGVNYKRKDDLSKICMGVIAQNVETQCPEVVYDHNGTKTVAYSNLIALLIEAIKELNEKINQSK